MGMVRRISVAGLAALASVALLGGCSSEEKNVDADVSVSSCTPDPGGGRPTANGGITNHSSKDSGYAFTVIFRDPAGNRVSEGAAAVSEVKPAANATWRVEGVTSAKGPLSCDITNVVRTAVP